MYGLLKRAWRSLFDRELGVVGDELVRAEARLEDLSTVVQALQVRFERLQNRVGMRLTRSEQGQAGGVAGTDREILRGLQRGSSNQGDYFDDDPRQWQ